MALVALVVGCSRQPSAESPSSGSSPTSGPAALDLAGYAEKLQAELPAGWTLTTTPTAINIRRISTIAYYIPQTGLRPMTKDEEEIFIDGHTRTAVLEIRMRFAPPLSPTESTRLAGENEQLVQRAEKEFPNAKGVAVIRYLDAHSDQKLHELPALQTPSSSIYIERPVRCEWLRDPAVKSQCETVDRAIAKLFSS